MGNQEPQSKKICQICKATITITRHTKLLSCRSCKECVHINCLNANKTSLDEINKKEWICPQCSINNQNATIQLTPNFQQMFLQIDECCGKDDPSNKDIIILLKGMLHSQEFISQQFEQLKTSVQSTVAENRKLKTSVEILEKKVQYLESEFNKIEQDRYKNNIVITGIPNGEKLNPKEVLTQIGKIIDVDISLDNIIQSRYMSSKNKQTKYSPIFFEFNNNIIKHTIMEKIKLNGPIVPAQLNITSSNKKITIHDYLTDFNKKLLQEIYQLKSEFSIKFIWSKHGAVFARQTETSNIIRINSASDIITLKEQLATSQIQHQQYSRNNT